MTDITQDSTLEFGDKTALELFLADHGSDHDRFNIMLALAGYGGAPNWDLYQMDNMDIWLDLHERMHSYIDRILGFQPPPDLGTANLKDAEEFYAWHYTHAILHNQERAALDSLAALGAGDPYSSHVILLLHGEA